MPSNILSRVALFEPGEHHEILHLLIGYYHHLGAEIHVLTTKENRFLVEEAGTGPFSILWSTIQKKDTDLTVAWLKRQAQVDLFVWITLPTAWYGFPVPDLPENSLLLLHNLHFWFAYESYAANPFGGIKTLSYQMLWLVYYRRQHKRWLSRFRHWGHLLDYRYLDSWLLPAHPRRPWYMDGERDCPMALNKELAGVAAVGEVRVGTVAKASIGSAPGRPFPLRIVIPGNAGSEGRDIAAIHALLLAYPSAEYLEIVFLGDGGSPRAIHRMQFLRKAAGPRQRVISFPHYLPAGGFREGLSRADFLWLPLKPWHCFGGTRERVGYSKVSGGVYTACLSGKLCLIPGWYPLPHFLKSRFLNYDSVADILRYCRMVAER